MTQDPLRNRERRQAVVDNGGIRYESEGPETEMDSWYFAYGSNLDPDRKQERTGRIREARLARLAGYRFAFNKLANDGSGRANVVRDERSEVWGVVYRCSAKALQDLDRKEGVPNHYTRETVKVALETGEIYDAVAYVACPDHVREDLKPSPKYLRHILEGARHHQLPEPHINFIEQLA